MLCMMDVHGSPTISSFVIRFVVESAADSSGSADLPPGCASYRGSIRHIQTEEELNFNTWVDAVSFIRRFVPIENIQAGSKRLEP